MAFRTITKADEPGYAALEWQMWLGEADPRALTMLPLVECVHSSDPERIAGLARHLAALSEDQFEGRCLSVDGDGFRAFVDAECTQAISFAGVVDLTTAQKLWDPANPAHETANRISLLSSRVPADIGQRLIWAAWGDRGSRLAAVRRELLANHQRLMTHPELGLPIHALPAEFLLKDNFVYRVLSDGRIHIARVLHHVGYFAYQLF
jgi:hypothetical protein